jgi:hypothetical protein
MITRALNWAILALVALYCLLTLWAPEAKAQTAVGVHLWSEHSKNEYEITHEGGVSEYRKFNEKNYGLYVVHNGWTAGTFENSYYRRTVYGGYSWVWPVYGPLDACLTVALATGYRRVPGVGTLRPMAMPGVRMALPEGIFLRYSVAPAKGGAFQHLSIERTFHVP